MRRTLLRMLCVGAGLALGHSVGTATEAAAAADAGETHRVVRNGMVVEFSATPAQLATAETVELLEGEFADVRFRITSESTGAPVRGVVPGAWMDMAQAIGGPAGSQQKSCKDKIALYVKGAVGIRPMIDLNSYFVVLLNKEASISVVDPLVTMAGATSTFATTALKQPGADWARNDAMRRLFVSMPKAGDVAVIETDGFKLVANVPAGREPLRAVLQPDERFVWIGNDAAEAKYSGVTVIDADRLQAVGFVPTGAGHHEIAFTTDSRLAFVSNRDDGTVSIIDAGLRSKVGDVRTGSSALALDYSPLSRRLYVADGKAGRIAVVDVETRQVVRQIDVQPGVAPLKVTPDGRFVLAANPSADVVYVIDTASDELVQEVQIKAQPYQITFSRTYALVRALGSARVSMITLATLGKDRRAVVQSFAAGDASPGIAANLPLADSMATAINEGTVFVVSPADGTTYYYREGMNAPSSNYRVYGSAPRAVTVVDRTLKEVEPGVYAGRVKLPVAGRFDVAFMLDNPPLLHCFSTEARANPRLQHAADPVALAFVDVAREIKAAPTVRLRFTLAEPATRKPLAGLKDVSVMYFFGPGMRRRVLPASEVGDGLYEVVLDLATPGAYAVHVAVPSLHVGFGKLPFQSLRVVEPQPVPAAATTPADGRS